MRKIVLGSRALISMVASPAPGLSLSSAAFRGTRVLTADSGALPAHPISGRQGPRFRGSVSRAPPWEVSLPHPWEPPAIPFLGERPFLGVHLGIITDTGGGKGAVSGGTMSPSAGRTVRGARVCAEELKVTGGGATPYACVLTTGGDWDTDTQRDGHARTRRGSRPHAKEGSEEPLPHLGRGLGPLGQDRGSL